MGVIIKDPDVLGGTPVFSGTRVPIQTLFDYLEGGETLKSFSRGFLPCRVKPRSLLPKKQNTYYPRVRKCAS